MLRVEWCVELITHAPLRLQSLVHGRLGEDLVAGQPADTAGAAANGAGLRRREAAAVASDRTSVAAVVGVNELAGRGKVETGEAAFGAEEVTVVVSNKFAWGHDARDKLTGWAARGAPRRRSPTASAQARSSCKDDAPLKDFETDHGPDRQTFRVARNQRR